ncbi:MAG: hypothetical protein AAB864_02455 [Patescibacteria group bacterium]
MKKTSLVGAVLVAVLVLTAAPTRAEEDGASPKVSPSRRAEALEKRDEKAKERVEKARTRNQERIRKFWEQMKRRLSVLIRNEKNLADRVQKRLDAQSENTNAAELKTKLDNAKKLIIAAETALSDADIQISRIASSSSEPKDAFKKVQELNKGVMSKIRAAHKALVEIISMTKRGLFKPSPTPKPSVSPTATPTPSPTPTS